GGGECGDGAAVARARKTVVAARGADAEAVGSHPADRDAIWGETAGRARPEVAGGFSGATARGGPGAFCRFVVVRGETARPGRIHRGTAGAGTRGTLRPGGAGLHAFDGAEPEVCGPGDATIVEGGGRWRERRALQCGGIERDRGALHGAGKCGAQGGAPDAEDRGVRFVAAASRGAFSGDHHRRVAEGDLCAAAELSGGRFDCARGARGGCG